MSSATNDFAYPRTPVVLTGKAVWAATRGIAMGVVVGWQPQRSDHDDGNGVDDARNERGERP
tara:strand:- start:8682 stop:8867 length:186 start_codon:yes stop_codon:yes gene_type:complete